MLYISTTIKVIKIFTKPENLTELKGEISILFYKISQGIEKMVREKGKEAGLSATQVRAVMFLSTAHQNSKNISSLARRLGIAQPTTTRAIDSLVDKGLVERRRSQDDRRKVELNLTEEGREMAVDFTDVSDSLREIIGKLPEKRQKELRYCLLEIVGEMQKKGQVSASLTCLNCRFFEPDGGKTGDRPHHCKLTGADLSEEESRQEWVHDKDKMRLMKRKELD